MNEIMMKLTIGDLSVEITLQEARTLHQGLSRLFGDAPLTHPTPYAPLTPQTFPVRPEDWKPICNAETTSEKQTSLEYRNPAPNASPAWPPYENMGIKMNCFSA